MLSEEQGQALVRLARQQIAHHLGKDAGARKATRVDVLEDAALQRKQGVFVTLHKNQQLRGCIGSLTATEAIVDGIRKNALHAAFQDYRFPALTSAELPDLHIEISILTEPEPLDYTGPEDLVRLLRPGIDGVILKGAGGEQATFLPQVWQQLPLTDQFLGHLCRKAGLPESAWRSGALSTEPTAITLRAFAGALPEKTPSAPKLP